MKGEARPDLGEQMWGPVEEGVQNFISEWRGSVETVFRQNLGYILRICLVVDSG